MILMMLSVSLTAYAERVVIKGTVVDREKKPLEFVTVRVGGTAIGTMSGIDGSYKLSCERADTITVIFSCVGYKDARRKIIDPEGEITINQTLMENTREPGMVEIEELRKQTGSMQKLDSKDYRLAADATGGSIESMLATTGGVNMNNELSSRYSVRGGSYDENSVYINGIEVYRPLLVNSGQQEGLSVINPDMVGAIGFSSGGFGAEYADKMSSALDITYRQPERFEGSVTASLMGGSVSIGQSERGFSQLHGVRYKRNSSLLSSMDTKGEYDPNFFDYQTNIGLKMSDKIKLSFLGNIALNNYKFTPKDRTTTFGTAHDAKKFKVYFDGHEKDKFETWSGALSLDYRIAKNSTLTFLASGFLTNELVTYDISGEYWLDEAGTNDGSESIGGELGIGKYMEHARDRLKGSVLTFGVKGATALDRHNIIEYGVSMNHETVMERTREWELRDSAGYSLPNDGENLRMIYNLVSNQDISSDRMSAFVQDRIKVQSDGGFWNISFGARLSYWSFNKELLVSPRGSVGFIPDANPDLALRLATGLYYQSPFYKELRMAETDDSGNTTVMLNKNIKSQRSFHLIFGADYTFDAFGRPFRLSGEAYYKGFGNLIPYEVDNLKVVYSGQNESSGYTFGVDMKLFGQFVPGSDSWISVSLMKSQEKLRGVNVPRPNDQRYSLGMFFTDYFPGIPKLKFSLRGVFSDGLPVTAPRSTRDKGYFRTPAYKRADVGVMYGIITENDNRRKGVRNMWLGVDVFNLFDISNVSSYYWVTDVNNLQYAVPNYLTRRQLNLKLILDF